MWRIGSGSRTVVVSLAIACSSTEQAHEGARTGTHGAPCYENGTCNAGLACVSGVCDVDESDASGASSGGRNGSGGRSAGGRSNGGAAPGSGGGRATGAGGSPLDASTAGTAGGASGGTRADAGSPLDGGDGGSGGGAVDAAPVDANYPTECDPVDFVARTDLAGGAFVVTAGTSELYQCFSYHVDLQGAPQAFSFEPLVQNQGGGVVQSILLYRSSKAETNGATSPCLGFHPDGILIAGWGPGAGPWILPRNVGTALSGNDYLLEIHYDNRTVGDFPDSSGIRMCAGRQARPNSATVSWLGNDIFGGFGVPGIPPLSTNAEISGACRPTLTAPVYTTITWPFMRRLGRRMRSVIQRAGGGSDVLFDKPYSYANEAVYATPQIVNPGDSILTTCTYDNPNSSVVGFGEATTSEMCFAFVTAYPASTLVGGGLHNNSCIQAP